MTNVVKHAGHNVTARIFLDWRSDALHIQVTDNGAGQKPGEQGVGLVGLCERLVCVGGTLTVLDQPVGFGLAGQIPYAAGNSAQEVR